MSNAFFSLIHYENNKLSYNNEKYKMKYIVNNIKDTIVLVLDNYVSDCLTFVHDKRYYKYFVDEKHNLDKTSYICWQEHNTNDDVLINTRISQVLLTNLPPQTKYIKFNDNYNLIIDMLADTKITHIIFGIKFNQSIDNLPWTIEYLYFGVDFNQQLDNLPGSMKKIIFTAGSNFNQSLDCLPNFLECLILPAEYNCRIDNLPNFLNNLELNYNYPNSLNNLPKSLEKFTFYSSSFSYDYNNRKIYKIHKSSDFEIPIVPCYYDEKTKKDDVSYVEKIFVSLPENLKYLDLTYSYKLNFLSDYVNYNIADKNCHVKKEMIKNSQILSNLPSNLEVLKYPSNYNLIMVEQIPQNIIKLFLSNKFNKSVDKLLNPNFGTSKPRPDTKITHLIFGDEFNQYVNFLPTTLTHIYFGSSFNKSIDKLPNSIKVMVLGKSFDNCIVNLPTNLIEITFRGIFIKPLNGIKSHIKINR